MVKQKISYACCYIVLATLGCLLGACTFAVEQPPQPSVGSCVLTLPSPVSDQQAIQAVLTAEGDWVVKQQIDDLMRLWAAGSRVSDAKNTPTKPDDDQTWFDKDAIRNRYVRIVFPGAPKQATPSDLEIYIVAARATVTATTHIGTEISPAGDRWELVKQGDCWLLESLTYNLEANKN